MFNSLPVFRYFVVTPQNAEWLQRQASIRNLLMTPNLTETDLKWGGMSICTKPGQVAECWMFTDRKTVERYLHDELSEADFVALATTRSRPLQSLL